LSIDLHTHTNASDGTDSPSGLIGNAVAAGLSAIALTDHDTTAGWDEAAATVQSMSAPFTLIGGAEFSCVYTAQDGHTTTLHLLGYLFDREHPELKSERERLRASRLGRAEAMVDRLAADGYPVSWPQVVTIANGGSVGRPHIAQALVDAGVVASVDEAFAGLIRKGSPYHMGKQDLDVIRAIDLIRAAGGVSVVAHVFARLRGPVLDEPAVEALIEAGLNGIEVDHVDHAPADRTRLREITAAHDLLATGSSDYHGARKGVPLGACTTSPEMLERIVVQAAGAVPITARIAL